MTHIKQLHLNKQERFNRNELIIGSIIESVLGMRKHYHPDFIAIVVSPKIFAILQTHYHFFIDHNNLNTFYATTVYVDYETKQDYIITTKSNMMYIK